MTSSVAGAHWDKHLLLEHAASGPIPVSFHLKFVIWDPAANVLVPVEGAKVRVMAGSAVAQAVQGTATVASDLEAKTGTSTGVPLPGEVSFEGTIAGPPPSGGLNLHFELSDLANVDWYVESGQTHKIPIGIWSTEGWKATDGVTPGKLAKFSGTKIGKPGTPVTFLVGVPCWLNFSYQRYYQEDPPARFPLGTRIKIITLDSSGGPVKVHDFRTDSSSELKTVLFTVPASAPLRMLIFTRFLRSPEDPADLVLNPFAVTTGDQSTADDNTAKDVLSSPSTKPFLYYDATTWPDPYPGAPAGPAGYAFHFTQWRASLKNVPSWIAAADTMSLCTWETASGTLTARAVAVAMPDHFSSADTQMKASFEEKITLCSALHAASAIREFHGLLSSLLASNPAWKGLNVHPNAYEAALVLTNNQGPDTVKINPFGPSGLRGKVCIPLNCLFDPSDFSIPEYGYNMYRYSNFRNIMFHELGHCLMYTYSFNNISDYSSKTDHVLNRFIDYSDPSWRKLPFWEGWAVYFSMLMLPPPVFLATQMTRIAAKDPAISQWRSSQLALIELRKQTLAADIDNIFASGIIRTFQVEHAPIKRGLTLAAALSDPAVAAAGVNSGHASELCLAFSLYSLTRFLVERAGKTLSGPDPSEGDGSIKRTQTQSKWYENPSVRAALWTAIFGPFWQLNGILPDTVRRFTGLIRTAMKNDLDWHNILKIFNTYYLLVETPQINSVQPAPASANVNAQTLTIAGSGFPALSTVAKDGGLTVEIENPATVQALAVNSEKSLSLTVILPVAGTYTVKLVGRWGELSHVITVQ